MSQKQLTFEFEFPCLIRFHISRFVSVVEVAARAELTSSPVSIWVQAVKLLFFLPLTRFTASSLCHLGSDGSLKPPASSHFFYLFREKLLKMQSNASVGVAEKPFLNESKCEASRRGPRGGWIRGRDKHHESAERKTRDLGEAWRGSRTR